MAETNSGRTCLLVLGMHRSGTSALTRALSLLGAALPRHLMPPANENNEAGFWEPERLAAANERLLVAAGSSWLDWRRIDFDRLSASQHQAFKDEILNLVVDEFGDAPLFVLKDPRICRLATFYREIFDQLNIAVRPILALRNPLEVVESLVKRDGIAKWHAAMMWLRYTLDAERDSRGLPRAMVDYDRLLVDGPAALAGLDRALGIGWTAPNETAYPQIVASLRGDLRHHASDRNDLAADRLTATLINDVYVAMTRLDQTTAGEFDAMTQKFDGATSFLAEAEADHRRLASVATNALRELDGTRQALDHSHRKLEQVRKDFEMERSEMAEERDALHRQYRNSTSWKVTAPLRLLRLRPSAVSQLGARIQQQRAGATRGTREELERHQDQAVEALEAVGQALHAEYQIPTPRRPAALPAVAAAAQPPRADQRPGVPSIRHYRSPAAANAPTINRDRSGLEPSVHELVDVVALYLPQFHPVPENDHAWGAGFTEWTNVARGKPEYADHQQPRIPADFGFYDLRLPTVQVHQAEAAARAGLSAFCYYHYWFDGREPLILPIDNHVDNAEISLKFCICFANENWTKRWDGLDHEVILQQTYGPDFCNSYWRSIRPRLASPKYLRDKTGRALFFIYRPDLVPDFSTVAARWREFAKRDGIGELAIIGCVGFDGKSAEELGLDGQYEFPPVKAFWLPELGRCPPRNRVAGLVADSRSRINDYRQYVMAERAYAGRALSPALIPCVMPSWDNTPRRPLDGDVFSDSTPPLFEEWIGHAARRAVAASQPIVLVNAWNEWAESAHLEPDRKNGWGYLAALTRALERPLATTARPMPRVCVFAHAFYEDVWNGICDRIDECFHSAFDICVTTTGNFEPRRPLSSFLGRFEVLQVPNRGRDILPFLRALKLMSDSYDVGLKLHTKKSPHLAYGRHWSKFLFETLMPGHGISDYVALFKEDPNIGFIAPKGQFVGLGDYYLGSNLNLMREIADHFGGLSQEDLATGRFIAGSMFWFRRDAAQSLTTVDLEPMFDEENNQLDGTAAHAFERLFALLAERRAYLTVGTNEVAGLLVDVRGANYPLHDRLRRFSGVLQEKGALFGQQNVANDGVSSTIRSLAQAIYQFEAAKRAYRVMPSSFRNVVKRAVMP